MRSANELYSKMLQYGSEHLEYGISLDEIKAKLRQEGYLGKNNDSDDYLKQWFQWSFEHKEKGCKCELRPDNKCGCDKDDPCYGYDHSTNCKHFISKDACIDYLHLSESERNLKSAKISRQISYIALIISGGILLLNFLNNYNRIKFTETEEYRSIKQEITEIKANTDLFSDHIYQLDTIMVDLSSNIKDKNKTEIKTLGEMSKSLKNINYHTRKMRENKNEK